MTDKSKPIQAYPAQSSTWKEIVTRNKERQDKIIAELKEKGENPVVHHIVISFSQENTQSS
jgi:hypothetical protein